MHVYRPDKAKMEVPVFIFDQSDAMRLQLVSRSMLMKKHIFLQVKPDYIQRIAVPSQFYNGYTFYENTPNACLRGIGPLLISCLKRSYFAKVWVKRSLQKSHRKLKKFKPFQPRLSRFAHTNTL